MALYGTVLDETELVNPETSIKDGFTVAVKPGDKAGDTKTTSAADTKGANDAQQILIDAAVKKALEEKQAEIDAANELLEKEKQAASDAKALEEQNAADLLDKAKAGAK